MRDADLDGADGVTRALVEPRRAWPALLELASLLESGGDATTCGRCRGEITPQRRGPIPKWCSATCRHRAWEQNRAAVSGRSAVQVVERQVQVRVSLNRPGETGRRSSSSSPTS